MVEEFFDLYKSRPLRQNPGGMRINHAFALWAKLRKLDPSFVIESGAWRGQSAWLIRKALPGATIVSLDPKPELRVHTEPTVLYRRDDFSQIDWSEYEKEDSLLIFDDHQNHLSRLTQMKWMGFHRAIFDDNYSQGEGDCYSLRKIFAGVGHAKLNFSNSWKNVPRALKRNIEERYLRHRYVTQDRIVRPNSVDAVTCADNLVVYEELQPLHLPGTYRPIFELSNWPHLEYRLPEPLLNESETAAILGLSPDDAEFAAETQYNNICYVQLR